MTIDFNAEKDALAAWKKNTEKLIASCQTMLAFAMLFMFATGLRIESFSDTAAITKSAILIFPVICLARLAYVWKSDVHKAFGWASAFFDIVILAVSIYGFSAQYGNAVATLNAPGFVYFFLLIALHAMRLNAKLVMLTGLLAASIWGVLFVTFLASGADVTNSYDEYLNAPVILSGAEVEKILGLLAFTLILSVVVQRAGSVVQDAASKQIAEVKVAEAEKTAQMKSEFLANMSHEIRTPMNGVLGMAQVLRGTDLSRDQREFVDTIERSGDALLTIINDILDFSKIEAGKLRLDMAAFDIREACEDVATLLGVTAREKGIDLAVRIQPDIPTAVVGDAGRFRQILTNLMGNALKFTEKGHVLVDVKGAELENYAQYSISVADSGIGIPQDKLHGIFAEFAQADGSTTRRFGGTGLGLSISRSLVELMGGKIKVASEEGKGSTFSFSIDLALDRRLRDSKPVQPPVNLSGLPILVVDDLEVNRDILRNQLEQLGANASLATNAKEAVAKLVAAKRLGEPFAIVITDFQMPDIDGLKLVRGIRKRTAFDTVQIIALSSIDSVEVKTAFLAEADTQYMTKPCRARELDYALREAATNFNTKSLIDISAKHKSESRPQGVAKAS